MECTAGSGNVFADLGLPDAEEMLKKANLVHQISRAIRNGKLTNRKAAAVLGIEVEALRQLIRGRTIRQATAEQLIGYLEALGETVEPFEPTLADIRAPGEPIVCVKPTEADLALYESQHFGASLGIHPVFSRHPLRRFRTKAELGEGKPDA